MAFLDLVNELTGVVPGLSPLLAEKYINRAWTDICRERTWEFLKTAVAVVCPEQTTDGSVSITQYSDTVTCDADASAALLAINTTAQPPLNRMSIRFGATSPAIGQVYNIIDADVSVPAAIVLTLDRIVIEATDADSGYQCYRPYIVPPTDFLAWFSFVDMVNAWPLKRDFTSAFFDLKDPQRQAQGLAYYLGAYQSTESTDGIVSATPFPNLAVGTTFYELWPHPTSGQTFYARYNRRGVDFTSPTDVLPAVIDDGLVISKALYAHAYPFAKANAANFPSFKGVNWTELIAIQKGNYDTDLITAKRLDNENALQDIYARGHGLRTGAGGSFKGMQDYPIDANFLQSHLVRF
jgi:hypothetical protein